MTQNLEELKKWIGEREYDVDYVIVAVRRGKESYEVLRKKKPTPPR